MSFNELVKIREDLKVELEKEHAEKIKADADAKLKAKTDRIKELETELAGIKSMNHQSHLPERLKRIHELTRLKNEL